MIDRPTHLVAGVTPGWNDVRVYDAETGELLKHVVEVDAIGGWVVQLVMRARGSSVRVVRDPENPGQALRRRTERPIRLVWPESTEERA